MDVKTQAFSNIHSKVLDLQITMKSLNIIFSKTFKLVQSNSL